MPSVSSLLLILLLAFGIAPVRAQKTEDVIRLEDGSLIRGTVTEESRDALTIRTACRSEWVLSKAGIVERFKEALPPEGDTREFFVKKHGYYSVNQIGFLAGNPAGIEKPISLQVQTIHGYQFLPQLAVGAGIGFDMFFPKGLVVPLFLDIRGDLSTDRITPIYYLHAGYNFPTYIPEPVNISWPPSGEQATASGGYMAELGLGFKIRTRERISWLVSMGYRQQATSEYHPQGDGSSFTIEQELKRITFRVGMGF